MVQPVGASPSLWSSFFNRNDDTEILGTDECSLARYEKSLTSGDQLVENPSSIQLHFHMRPDWPYGHGLGSDAVIRGATVTIYGHDAPAAKCKPTSVVDGRGVTVITYCNSRSHPSPRGFTLNVEATSQGHKISQSSDILLPPGVDTHREPLVEIREGEIFVTFYKKDAP